MLYGDRFIGRIEQKADRQATTLAVRNGWLEPGVRLTRRLSEKIESAARRLARFNECSLEDMSGTPVIYK